MIEVDRLMSTYFNELWRIITTKYIIWLLEFSKPFVVYENDLKVANGGVLIWRCLIIFESQMLNDIEIEVFNTWERVDNSGALSSNMAMLSFG